MKIESKIKMYPITDRTQCNDRSFSKCCNKKNYGGECNINSGPVGFPDNCPLEDAKEEKK